MITSIILVKIQVYISHIDDVQEFFYISFIELISNIITFKILRLCFSITIICSKFFC
jgi:hypothetical protein